MGRFKSQCLYSIFSCRVCCKTGYVFLPILPNIYSSIGRTNMLPGSLANLLRYELALPFKSDTIVWTDADAVSRRTAQLRYPQVFRDVLIIQAAASRKMAKRAQSKQAATKVKRFSEGLPFYFPLGSPVIGVTDVSVL